MNSKFRIAFIGLGNRGKDVYIPEFLNFKNEVEIVAISDINKEKLCNVAKLLKLDDKMCFSSGEELLAQPKLADAVCISTMDRQHVSQAIAALRLGYHILLEKPVSPNLDECREISRVAKETGLKVVVCHVLRYTSFFKKVKEIMNSGTIGEVVAIQAIENVGYWHQAHSFVRGNFSVTEKASPMILQKCCHDMDLYLWLTNKKSKNVSSFGGIKFFKAENAPNGSTEMCLGGCAVKENCPYDAEKIYIDDPKYGIKNGNTGWPNVVLSLNPTVESIYNEIKTGRYGRCVFKCDNDVVDHQVVNIDMTDGSSMSFTMCGNTIFNSRQAKFMGTLGELVLDMHTEEITVYPFGKEKQVYKITNDNLTGHGGGDGGIVSEFVSLMLGKPTTDSLTSLDVSLESHFVALAAEQSRLENGKVIETQTLREG